MEDDLAEMLVPSTANGPVGDIFETLPQVPAKYASLPGENLELGVDCGGRKTLTPSRGSRDQPAFFFDCSAWHV